jgi:HK97 family phage portal protein
VHIRTPDGQTVECRAQMGASGYLPWGNSVPPPPGTTGGSAAGVHVTETTAQQIAAVYGSVSTIADDIAILPIKTFQVAPGRPAQEIRTPTVVEEPFSEISSIDFRVQGCWSLLLRGNLNGLIITRNKRNPALPEQVKPIHPNNVRGWRIPSGPQKGQIEWRYHGEVVPNQDVVHVRGQSVAESVMGIDPITAMRHVFGNAQALDQYQGAYFANSSRPDGVIKVKGDLDANQTRDLAMGFMQHHQGIGHAYLPAVITGDADYIPITISPQNAQFLEQMAWSASVISGMIFRVPPHKLGMTDKSTSWGSGIEHQEIGYITGTCLGWIRRFEIMFSSWLPVNQIAVLDLSHRLRGDSLQRWQVYQIGRVIGAMNSAEVRNAEGMPVVDDDTLGRFDQPLNSSPMKPVAPATGPDQKD